MKVKFKLSTKRIAHYIWKQIPNILTAGSIVGTAATAYYTYEGYKKAVNTILQNPDDPDKIAVLKAFVPAAASMAFGIGCSIGSNRVAHSRLVQSETNYRSLLADYKKYEAAVIGAIGAETNNRIQTSLAKPEPAQTEDLPEKTYIFYDPITRQHFESTLEAVMEAEADFNHRLARDAWATIEDYCNAFGLPKKFVDRHGNEIDAGRSDLGWDAGEMWDWQGDSWLEFWNERISAEGEPVWYYIHVGMCPSYDGVIDYDFPGADELYDEYGLAKTASPWMKGGKADV